MLGICGCGHLLWHCTLYIHTFECKFRSSSHIKDLALNTQGNYDLSQLLPEWMHLLQYTLVAALKHLASGLWTILIQISLALLGSPADRGLVTTHNPVVDWRHRYHSGAHPRPLSVPGCAPRQDRKRQVVPSHLVTSDPTRPRFNETQSGSSTLVIGE